MNNTIPIELSTLRNLIFDVGGLDKEFVETIELPLPLITAIIDADPNKQYFHIQYPQSHDDVARLWQPHAYKRSSERYYTEKERSKRSTDKWNLHKEACLLFAKGVHKLAGTDRETGIQMGAILLRKGDLKSLVKFAAISGVDIVNDEKWKGLVA